MELELRAEMVRSGETIESMAEKVGISQTAMFRKVKGRTEFKHSEIIKIKTILNLSEQQFKTIFFNEE